MGVPSSVKGMASLDEKSNLMNQRQVGKDAGFTLIEVLVAVVILSIGIFGLIALESVSLRNTQSAYLRSQATILLYDMADKIRSNRTVDFSSITAASNSNCSSYTGMPSGCDASQLGGQDLYEWQQNLASILPAGSGAVTSSGSVTSVSVNWDDDRNFETAAQSFSMSFEL